MQSSPGGQRPLPRPGPWDRDRDRLELPSREGPGVGRRTGRCTPVPMWKSPEHSAAMPCIREEDGGVGGGPPEAPASSGDWTCSRQCLHLRVTGAHRSLQTSTGPGDMSIAQLPAQVFQRPLSQVCLARHDGVFRNPPSVTTGPDSCRPWRVTSACPSTLPLPRSGRRGPRSTA